MISGTINSTVHLVSLLIFAVLFYLLLKRRREHELLRAYLCGSLARRVQVEWPLRFVSQFCSALEIPLHGSGSLFAGSPKTLQKQVLFETLLLYGIDAIQYKVESDGHINLVLQCSKRIPNKKLLEKELCAALKLEVRLVSSDEFSFK